MNSVETRMMEANRQEQKKNPQNRKEDLGVQGSGMGRIQFFRIVNG